MSKFYKIHTIYRTRVVITCFSSETTLDYKPLLITNRSWSQNTLDLKTLLITSRKYYVYFIFSGTMHSYALFRHEKWLGFCPGLLLFKFYQISLTIFARHYKPLLNTKHYFLLFLGTIHSYAWFIHEKWPGFRTGLFHHCPIDL